MRANITYSVGMEEIPEEITRIIQGLAQFLSDSLYDVQAKLREKNFTSARQLILKARESLGDSDLRLYELDQILASYVDMINKQEGQEDGDIEQDIEQGIESSAEEEEEVENG